MHPSVLIIGPAQIGQMAWFVRMACVRLGWATRVLDNRAFMRRGLEGRIGAAIDLAERRRHHSRRRDELQRRIMEAAHNVDLVLVIKGEHITVDTVTELSSRAKAVNWHPDHPVFEPMFDHIAAYTLFCPKDTWTECRLSRMGFRNVVALPHASDPRVLGGSGNLGAVDVSVLGSIYPYRLFWIRRMASQNLSIRVWGGRVTGIPNVHSERAQAVGADQGRAFRAGAITLNTQSTFDIAGANQRLFDAAAAGVAQITEERSDSRTLLGRDCIAMFNDGEEFDAELARVLKDRIYRESLARNARRMVEEHHTYEHRLRMLLGLLWG